MVRIIHLSDIHFGCENKAAVAAARDYVRSTPFDLLAVTGDVTTIGAETEFQAAADWLKALPGPQLGTPGNHDTPYANLVARLFWPFRRYDHYLGPAWRDGLSLPGLAAQSINTSRGAQIRINWSKGAIHESDTERAARSLARSPAGTLRVALCHHPLLEVTGGPMTGRVRGGRGCASILAEGEVDLVLSGHVHTPFALALPCHDERTYAVGAGTLSLRERGAPAGFNVIDADDATVTVTAQGWTGSAFEPFRTWSLPRRQAAPPSAVAEAEELARAADVSDSLTNGS
jgi:3',5'-cyclic AMP phosphodiesterase CpdA